MGFPGLTIIRGNPIALLNLLPACVSVSWWDSNRVATAHFRFLYLIRILCYFYNDGKTLAIKPIESKIYLILYFADTSGSSLYLGLMITLGILLLFLIATLLFMRYKKKRVCFSSRKSLSTKLSTSNKNCRECQGELSFETRMRIS